MGNSMWYVLYVKAGQEVKVRNELQRLEFTALAPVEDRPIRKGGGWTVRQTVIFPSYIFVNLAFTAENYYKVKAIPHVIRFLGDARSPSALTHLEAEWIRIVAGDGEPLKPSKVSVLEDGTVLIREGILESFTGRNIKIDKRSRKATAALTLCGEPKEVRLSIEIV